jgi:hypothetical protein
MQSLVRLSTAEPQESLPGGPEAFTAQASDAQSIVGRFK